MTTRLAAIAARRRKHVGAIRYAWAWGLLSRLRKPMAIRICSPVKQIHKLTEAARKNTHVPSSGIIRQQARFGSRPATFGRSCPESSHNCQFHWYVRRNYAERDGCFGPMGDGGKYTGGCIFLLAERSVILAPWSRSRCASLLRIHASTHRHEARLDAGDFRANRLGRRLRSKRAERPGAGPTPSARSAATRTAISPREATLSAGDQTWPMTHYSTSPSAVSRLRASILILSTSGMFAGCS